MSAAAQVVLYSTSITFDPRVRADIESIKRILTIKSIHYEEVDLAAAPQRRVEMLAASKQISKLPQLHVNGKVRRPR